MNNAVTARETQARQLISQKTKMIGTIVNNDKAKTSTFASALVAMASDKNLMGCNVEDILHVGFQIVQAGLNPNKLFGQAYVVPYGKVPQLQIGYKGWISLGYRNGWTFKAVAVYNCDEFDIEFMGFEDKITFKPNFEQRDEDESKWVKENLKGVMVYAKDSQNNVFTEFVGVKKLEKLRLSSPMQKNKDALAGVWNEWAEEMYKAKALKYVITRLPINDSIMNLVVAENEVYQEKPQEQEQPKVDLNAIAEQAQKDEPQEVSDVEVVEEIDYKGELMKALTKRQVNIAKARKKVIELTDEQAEAYLEDAGALDALCEELKG